MVDLLDAGQALGLAGKEMRNALSHSMVVYHKKLCFAFFCLGMGLISGIGFQYYKTDIGIDDFWNVRLPLSVILGTLLFYSIHYVWTRLLKLIVGSYTVRIQMEDMKTYLPLGLILLFPLQKRLLLHIWPKSLFPLFICFLLFFTIVMKLLLIIRLKREHPEGRDVPPEVSVGKGWLCMAAFVLSLPVFGFHQVTLAHDDFYGLSRRSETNAFYSRHDWVTRKTFPHGRRIAYSSDIPLNTATSVVGYKILEAPKGVFAPPVTFSLSVYDEAGNLLDEQRDTLDPARSNSREWHNFETSLSSPKGSSINFEMEAKPDLLARGWADFLKLFVQPLKDFSHYRNAPLQAAWSEPEIVSSKRERPNVILISLDTLRADALGCYGAKRNVSPAIDRFAGENLLFENAFCQSTWTLSSHLSLFTGKFPNELFDVMSVLPIGELDVPEGSLRQVSDATLAEILNRNGYYCSAFTDGVYVSSYYGLHAGFHLYDEQYGPDKNSFRLAQKWIDTNTEKNLFLFIHTYAVHEYDACGAGYVLTLRGTNQKDRDELFRSVSEVFPDVQDPESFLTNDHARRRRDWYDVRVRLVDSYINEFFSFLKEKGVYDDSLIIVLSDHGEAFDEFHDNRLRFANRHGCPPYESLARVPLIIKLPGASPNPLRIGEDVRLLDIPQTVMAILGLPADPAFRGRCIVPGFSGTGTDEYPFSFATWSVPGGSLRETGRKYIYHGEESPDEFYNLDEDPDETTNLAPLNTDEVLRFREKYRAYIEDTGAGGITVVESAKDAPPDIRKNLKALGYIE